MAGNIGDTGNSSGVLPNPKSESHEENSGISQQLLQTDNPETAPQAVQTPQEPAQVSRPAIPLRQPTQRPQSLLSLPERMEGIKETLRERKRFLESQNIPTRPPRRAKRSSETTPPELKKLPQNFNPNISSSSADSRPSVIPFKSTSPYDPKVSSPLTPAEVPTPQGTTSTPTSPFKPIVSFPVTPGGNRLLRPSLIPISSPSTPNASFPLAPEPPSPQVNSASPAAKIQPPSSLHLQASSSELHCNQQTRLPSSLYVHLQTPQQPQSLLRRLQTGVQTIVSPLDPQTDPILLGLAQHFERTFRKTLSRERLEYMTKGIVGVKHDTWVQAVIIVMAAASSFTDLHRWTPFQCFDQLMRSAKWILGGAAHVDLQTANFLRLTQLELEFYPPHDLLGFEEMRYDDWRIKGPIYDICPLAHVFAAPRWKPLTLSLVNLAYADPQKALAVFNRLQETMVFFV